MSFLVRGLTAPELDFNRTITLDDEVTAPGIEAALAPDGLAGFAILRLDELHPTPLDAGRDPFVELATDYGADEFREVAILYTTPGGTALGGMGLLRYGDRWYIWNLTSMLLGLMLGEVQPSSEAAYVAAVAYING